MTREELIKFEPLWDKWYVQEYLGGGSFGDVYRITCQMYERTYEAALKVISIPRDQSELNEVLANCETKEDTISYYDYMRQSITAEIDMMEQLKGRTNIVSYEDHDIIPHNHGTDPGYDIFIRMELLEDLSSVIGRESKDWSDNKQIVKMGMDIAEGLRVCHSHHIIHRDIKISNIFRSKDGDYKIGDFGIARSMSDDQLTMSVKGTFYFMPPEVYNREHYDYRADIYSLGMVLYRLLNKNRGPFMPLTGVPTAEQKEMDLARRMRGEQLPAPILAGQKLGEIILKACEYQKEKRFQSMEEFYQALCSLTQEDMERPGSMISDNEQTVVPRKEMFQGDDNETIALNQLPGDQTITTSSVYKENTYIVDDDRTVKMNMPKMESEGIAPPVVPQEELVGDHPSAIKEHRGKRVHVGIVGVVLAVVCLCAAFVLPRVLLEQSTKDDEVAQEETQKTLEDPTVSNEKSEDEEAKDETKNKPEEKIMIDAIPEVNALISDYYKAYASGDVVALEKMARPISDSEKSYIKVFSEYVDFYDNLSCYTKSGVRDGEYIVSVYLEIKFKDVPTAAPGLDFFYLRTNEIGQLYIDNVYSWFNSSMMEYDTEADIAALISDFEQDEKILKLQSEVQQKYEQAVAADERLAIIADEVIPNDVITKWEQSLPQ